MRVFVVSSVSISSNEKSVTQENVRGGAPDEEECGICYEAAAKAALKTLSCTHAFHKDCVETWVKKCKNDRKDPTCPLCRAIIPEEPDPVLSRSLVLAAIKGDVRAVKDLVSKDATLSHISSDSRGEALYSAITQGREDLVSLLTTSRAFTRSEKFVARCLQLAIEKKDENREIYATVVGQFRNLKRPLSTDDRTSALEFAVQKGASLAAEALMENGPISEEARYKIAKLALQNEDNESLRHVLRSPLSNRHMISLNAKVAFSLSKTLGRSVLELGKANLQVAVQLAQEAARSVRGCNLSSTQINLRAAKKLAGRLAKGVGCCSLSLAKANLQVAGQLISEVAGGCGMSLARANLQLAGRLASGAFHCAQRFYNSIKLR
jgi:hypothetical protein